MASKKSNAERAAEALLAELHKVLAESMLEDLRNCVGLSDDGGRRVVPYQLYSNIIKFLKDNHIEALLLPADDPSGDVPQSVIGELTGAMQELGEEEGVMNIGGDNVVYFGQKRK